MTRHIRFVIYTIFWLRFFFFFFFSCYQSQRYTHLWGKLLHLTHGLTLCMMR